MKAPQDIILTPIVTEATMNGIAAKKYTFRVATDANKIEIGKAIEQLFPGTKVAKVNTVSCKGKFKRVGYNQGYKSDWKKAIVTLTPNSKTIEFFDSMM